MSGTDGLLMFLLECGSLDLGILDDVGYDLGENVDDLISEGVKPRLNAITGEIFRKGQSELAEKLKDVIEDTRRSMEEAEDEEDTGEYERLEEKLEALESLNPEEDIDWFCNCLDTSVWFSENEEVYRKHLEKEISDVEDGMGFSF